MNWYEFLDRAQRIQANLEAKAKAEGRPAPPAGCGEVLLALYLRNEGRPLPVMPQ